MDIPGEVEERSAGVDDVRSCYRLFLGREPESDEVVLEKVGQTRGQVVEAFLSSGEFASEVLGALQDGGAAADRLYADQPGAYTAAWVARWLGVDPVDLPTAAPSRLELLAAIVSMPGVGKALDDAHGEGVAQRMVLAARGTMTRPRPALRTLSGRPYTTREDVRSAHRLLLDQEAGVAVAFERTQHIFDMMCDLLVTAEFRHKLVEPALQGRQGRDLAIGEALGHWVSATFDVAPARNRLKAIAAILRQPAIVEKMKGRVEWSLPEVTLACELSILDAYSLTDCLMRQGALLERAAA